MPDAKPKKTKNNPDFSQQVVELTADLQRTRADFENYRKRCEGDISLARENGRAAAILKLLPVIDNIERAVDHIPEELHDNAWAQGIDSLAKSLDKSLDGLGLKRIVATPGTVFDPNLHDAIQFDEEAEGEREIIAEELQSGYLLGDSPIRHAMVRVTRQ